MGKIFVQDLRAGEPVVSYFLVTGKQERQKKTGESFLSLTLGDRTGQVAAVLWDAPEREDRGIGLGRIVKVQGTVGSYQGETQLVIQRIRPMEDGEVSLEDFFPRSARDVITLGAGGFAARWLLPSGTRPFDGGSQPHRPLGNDRRRCR